MKKGLFLFSLLLIVASCQRNSYSTFSRKYRVWYSCDITVAPFNQVTSPGRFVAVRKVGNKLYTIDSDGHEIKDIELSAQDNMKYQMGLAGLIIGFPKLNNDEQSVWAFDLGCPECNLETARLSFDTNGTATCSKCKGTWDLNTSGYPTNGEFRPLYRYPVMRSDFNIIVAN